MKSLHDMRGGQGSCKGARGKTNGALMVAWQVELEEKMERQVVVETMTTSSTAMMKRRVVQSNQEAGSREGAVLSM